MASAGLSEDLLIQILVPLPLKSVLRFRCVSKSWKSIISTPFFLQTYHQHHRKPKDTPCLVALMKSGCFPSDNQLTIIPLGRTNHDYKPLTWNTDELGYFVNSSNGLTLWYYFSIHECKILNTLTGETVSLPRPICGSCSCMALVCDESTQELVPSYKVFSVYNHRTVRKTLIMNTYSSKTSKWTSSTVSVKEDVRVGSKCRPLLVVNGVIHWILFDRRYLVVYDSNGRHLRLIKLPNFINHGEIAMSAAGNDDLWIVFCESSTNKKTFWMLPESGNDSSLTTEWILKYTLSFNDSFREILGVSIHDSIYFDAIIPGKPHIAFLRTNQKMFLYNIESKSAEEIQFHHDRFDGTEDFYFYYEPAFCLSSYALSAVLHQ